MQKEFETLPEIKLVGINARTTNAAEMVPETAKIGATFQKFFAQGIADQIASRSNPGRLFSVYTDFESDHTGEYTYFLGEEVTSFDGVSDSLETMVIPRQDYAKFTAGPGPMPAVVIDAWQKIWRMEPSDFGGDRAYVADFEIHDPNNAAVDIYIGKNSE